MFQSNVKQIMERKGITLRKLAELSEVSKQTIVKARSGSGISECRLSTLGRVAKALEVGTKELYEEEDTFK